MDKNLTCGIPVYGTATTNFYVLSENCSAGSVTLKTPATTILFSIETLLGFVLASVTCWKYNSISVLNLSIRISAISNTWWIVYFIVIGIRSILNAVKYSYRINEEGLFIGDWILVTFEALILSFAINYQRKYRSSAHVNAEIDKYSKSEKQQSQREWFIKNGILRTVTSSSTILCILATVVLIMITLFETLDKYHAYFFWVYVGFSLILHLASLILAIMIAIKTVIDGPNIFVKILLFMGTLLVIPVDIPEVVWHYCVGIGCVVELTLFDFWIIAKIVSLLLWFLALRSEYKRLKQECQWAMLNEVQRFSF